MTFGISCHRKTGITIGGNMRNRANIVIGATLRHYKKEYLWKDLLAGLIVAAVSIPISMGYAQIAGLPAVYGLYGSVFPILIFALLTSSGQFVFGVDAAPAALVGASIAGLGIQGQSEQAMLVVPVITFCTAIILLFFYVLGAGSLVNYISLPVMGGFISGICMTIILMQIPKLFGGTAGTGELFELLIHLAGQLSLLNFPSLLLGLCSLGVLLWTKKKFPKLPMAVILMVLSALFFYYVPLESTGITCLSAVEKGLPDFRFPSFHEVDVTSILGTSLSVAVVIMTETLLSENSFAMKNRYKINDNGELLAFSMANLVAAFTGCCPVNGSVSRTTLSEQYGGRTQLSSLVAGITMIIVLLFATGFIGYLPVPVLTAIVISALIGALEFDLSATLWRTNRKECAIFWGAFFGVLVFGTINGVLIGVLLSFVDVVLRAADPPRSFLGMIPGHEDFISITKYKHAYPLRNVVIYRFSSNLFFANAAIFSKEIEGAIKPDTKAVIVDASGIGSVDVTAAGRLLAIYELLREKNVQFYLTEHVAKVNVSLRTMGAGKLIEEGAVCRTMEEALKRVGMTPPYQIEGEHEAFYSITRKRVESSVQEFIWLYGDQAEEEIERLIQEQIEKLKGSKNLEELFEGRWNQLESMDADEWLEHLEGRLTEIAKISGEDTETIARRFEQRRARIARKIAKEHPELSKRFMERRKLLDERLKKEHPEVYEMLLRHRREIGRFDE